MVTITTYISPPGRPSNYPTSRPFSDNSLTSPLFQPRWTIMIFEDQWSSKITASSFIWSENLQREIPSNSVVQCLGLPHFTKILFTLKFWPLGFLVSCVSLAIKPCIFRLLVPFMFFCLFDIGLNQRHVPVCHQPPLVTNETVGKEQSITSLCPNPCLDRRLHQFYRPFPPLLAKGLFRKSCFWQLCATPYKQVSWAQTSFSASLQQIWKAKRFLMLNLWKLNEKNHLRVVCKKVKTASPKATPFSFGFVWEAAMLPLPPLPPAPAAAPWKPAAHQSRQSSLPAQQLSNDHA